MISFDMVMMDIEVYPPDFPDQNLISAIKKLEGKSYKLTCNSPNNNFQLNSNFDLRLKKILIDKGAIDNNFNCIEKSMIADFALLISDKKIVFEAEKSNKEKILYDFLKFHIYFNSGADICVLICPRNWLHSKGIYDLFSEAKARLDLCVKYGMINNNLHDKIFVVGYNQFYNNKILDSNGYSEIKKSCRQHFSDK